VVIQLLTGLTPPDPGIPDRKDNPLRLVRKRECGSTRVIQFYSAPG
jgi:hypothetical protein